MIATYVRKCETRDKLILKILARRLYSFVLCTSTIEDSLYNNETAVFYNFARLY